MIKQIAVVIIDLLLACTVCVANPPKRHWPDQNIPSISGITLGSSFNEVLIKLGDPIYQTETKDSLVENSGVTKKLVYPGLSLELHKSEQTAEYHVWRIEVTNNEWIVAPGLKIGMYYNEVKKLLGKQLYSEGKKGEDFRMWWDPPFKFDSVFMVHFVQGNVAGIVIEEDFSL